MPNDQLEINASGFFQVTSEVDPSLLEETSVQGIDQYESILSPAAYQKVTVQSTIHAVPNKNYDAFKGKVLTIKTSNPNIYEGLEWNFSQLVYRMETRKPFNNNIETFTLVTCDPSLLNNAQRRMSNFWQCTSPSDVAAAAFSCLGVTQFYTEPSMPARDYQAANIHPFQVLAEQADVALSLGDPSFLHYATLLKGGMQYFQSIKAMTRAPVRWQFVYAEEGGGEHLANPHNILSYEFPCDFDYLGDLMNGYLPGGVSASTIAINPTTGTMALINGDLTACGGMGGAIVNSVITDTGSADSCGTAPEDYTSLRQARLSLIQPDKIALKIQVPYNPVIHAGDMVECRFINKVDGSVNYGTGLYLIVNLQNSLRSGGYGITSMELVSQSVGDGIV